MKLIVCLTTNPRALGYFGTVMDEAPAYGYVERIFWCVERCWQRAIDVAMGIQGPNAQEAVKVLTRAIDCIHKTEVPLAWCHAPYLWVVSVRVVNANEQRLNSMASQGVVIEHETYTWDSPQREAIAWVKAGTYFAHQAHDEQRQWAYEGYSNLIASENMASHAIVLLERSLYDVPRQKGGENG